MVTFRHNFVCTYSKIIVHDLNHVILFLGELEPLETSVDLCNVLTSGAKFCKHCDTAVQANMVKYKKSELEPLLTKSEKDESHDELYFCDENCYFQFAIGRADKVSFQKKILRSDLRKKLIVSIIS